MKNPVSQLRDEMKIRRRKKSEKRVKRLSQFVHSEYNEEIKSNNDGTKYAWDDV